jgi:hypothetical protein
MLKKIQKGGVKSILRCPSRYRHPKNDKCRQKTDGDTDKKYRKLSRIYHPDKNNGCVVSATDKFKLLKNLCFGEHRGINKSHGSQRSQPSTWHSQVPPDKIIRKWVFPQDDPNIRFQVPGPGPITGSIILNDDDSSEPVFHEDQLLVPLDADDFRLKFITHQRLKELIVESPTMKTDSESVTVIFPLEDTRNKYGPRRYSKHFIILCSLEGGEWSVMVEDNEAIWKSEKSLIEKYYLNNCLRGFVQLCDYMTKSGIYNLSSEAGGQNGGSKSRRKKSRSKKIKKKKGQRKRQRKSLKSKRR